MLVGLAIKKLTWYSCSVVGSSAGSGMSELTNQRRGVGIWKGWALKGQELKQSVSDRG